MTPARRSLSGFLRSPQSVCTSGGRPSEAVGVLDAMDLCRIREHARRAVYRAEHLLGEIVSRCVCSARCLERADQSRRVSRRWLRHPRLGPPRHRRAHACPRPGRAHPPGRTPHGRSVAHPRHPGWPQRARSSPRRPLPWRPAAGRARGARRRVSIPGGRQPRSTRRLDGRRSSRVSATSGAVHPSGQWPSAAAVTLTKPTTVGRAAARNWSSWARSASTCPESVCSRRW